MVRAAGVSATSRDDGRNVGIAGRRPCLEIIELVGEDQSYSHLPYLAQAWRLDMARHTGADSRRHAPPLPGQGQTPRSRVAEHREVNHQDAPAVARLSALQRCPQLALLTKPTEQVHLCIGGPGLTRSDPRRHAQAVLDTMLGGLMSSRLFQEVREKRGLAYSVGSYTAGYADAGQVVVHLGTREDNLATCCAVIQTELRKLRDASVSDTELRRAQDHLKGRLVLGTESPATRMNRLGRAVVTDTELLTIDEIIDLVEAVQGPDIQALAAEFWQPEAMSVAAVGPNPDLIRTGIANVTPHLAEAAALDIAGEALAR